MKIKPVFFYTGAFIVLWSWHCFAAQPDVDAGRVNGFKADLVWAQSDGLREEIFLSTFKNGTWGKPVPVTDDNADNLHPAVDQTSNGTRWIAWTAVESGSYSILARSLRGGQLGEIMTISRELPMNIYPTVVVDSSDTVWIIWSGNEGNNDDIYYSRLVAGKWQPPRRLHPANQVPDIQPFVFLNSNGMPLVQWKRFVDGSYREFESHWSGRTWSVPQVVEKDDTVSQVQKDDSSIDLEKMVLEQSDPEGMKNAQSEFLKIYQ